MKKKRIFSALAALLMCLSLPVFASASQAVEPRFTMGWRWENCPSTIYFYCDGSCPTSHRNAIRSAMNKWNAVKTPDGDSMITVALTTDTSKQHNKITYGSLSDGPGYMRETVLDGYIVAANIILSDTANWSTVGASNAYDVQTVFQHELGHALGVAHCHESETRAKCYSSTCLKNVMNPDIAKGQKRTTFQEYDTSSYILIYW